MIKLKGIFSFCLGILLILTSCDPIENSFTMDSYQLNIFTVGNNNSLKPELKDTLLYANNFRDFDLKPGDRACLYLYSHQDAYNPKNSFLRIEQLIEKIPTLHIEERNSIDESVYNLPLSVTPYFYEPSIWIWNNILNINALFATEKESTEFAMELRGIQEDFVELNLLAKSTVEPESPTTSSKLLSYDLNNIEKLFTDEEKEALKDYEKLRFRIHLKKNASEWDVKYVSLGEFINPLYN